MRNLWFCANAFRGVLSLCVLRSALFVLLLFSFFLPAEVVESPKLVSRSLGAETLLFRWGGGLPYAEGGYDSRRKEYTLSGNGQGVYWCVDACALAHVENPPVRGSFTFTARVKDVALPENSAPAHIGIMVKGRLTAPAHVLALRWDTYWESRGSGLTWFNRITPRDTLEELHADFAEKQCHGTGQGCRGYGYENVVEGFDRLEGLWLRVRRTVSGDSDKYQLFARSDSTQPWSEIAPVAGTHNACGNDPLEFRPLVDLSAFSLPDIGDEVYPALYVAHGSNGEGIVTATFDNISLEIDNPDEVHSPRSTAFPDDATWWPSYMGPYSNFSTVTSENHQAIDRLADAQQVWKSEYIHPARIDKGDRGNVWNAGIDTTLYDGIPSGGGAGPVAADGRVYLYWYASHYDEATESWLETADDVILCLDAEDGSTLWKKIFPGAARDVAFGDGIGKKVMKNHTPCVYEGNVYVCNSIGVVYSLNAETGELNWKGNAGGAPGTSALVCADGALVMGIGGCRACQDADLVAFDCSTGAQLWRKANALGGAATPTRWTHDDNEYILAASATNRELRLIYPRSGEELWKLSDVGHNRFPISVNREYALVNIGGQLDWGGKPDSGQVAGYRISTEGAEKIWELPKEYGYPKDAIVIHENAAYLALKQKSAFLAVDVATGTIQSEFKYPRPGEFRSGWASVVDDRYVYEIDGSHWTNECIMFQADPESFTYLGAKWVPPHPNTTSYVIPLCRPYVDGRVFMRGYDAVYCYDFRKDGELSAQPAPKERSSVSRQGNRLEVRKYPDKLHVSFDRTSAVNSRTLVVTLFDPKGRVVRQSVVSPGTVGNGVSIERPSNGMYILQLSDGLGRITRRKIGL